jgi:hypothetical protein
MQFKTPVNHRQTVSIRQAAWLFAVPVPEVHRAIRRGTLRAVWRRSTLVVLQSDIERLMRGDRP